MIIRENELAAEQAHRHGSAVTIRHNSASMVGCSYNKINANNHYSVYNNQQCTMFRRRERSRLLPSLLPPPSALHAPSTPPPSSLLTLPPPSSLLSPLSSLLPYHPHSLFPHPSHAFFILTPPPLTSWSRSTSLGLIDSHYKEQNG